MNHDVDVFHGFAQALRVAHVPDEPAHDVGVRAERLPVLHFELLQLISAEYNDPGRIAVLEQRIDKAASE